MQRSPDHSSEGGFTLIETLVMLAVSAIIAALVIPISSRGMHDNFWLADRALRSDGYAASETEYRRLLRQAVPPLVQPDGSVRDRGLIGTSTRLRFPVESEQGYICPGVVGYVVVQLRIERKAKGGTLLCESATGSYKLLEWEAGEASFSYSPDSADWLDAWPMRARRSMPEIDVPPLVRITLRRGRHNRLIWVERAGDPALRDPTVVDPGPGTGAAFRLGRRS